MVTVIASQAVITGAFSIAQQAIYLGLLPRMNISHTSETEHGQIYVSQINWMLFIAVILLVLTFRSSTNLAAAYGIAVNASMIIDTLLAFLFFWKALRWPLPVAVAVMGLILCIESAFLVANGYKIVNGGYVPLLIGFAIIVTMLTWMRGRDALAQKLRRDSVELVGLLESLERKPPVRVPGAGVFLVTDPNYAPSALLHNLKHNRVLHRRSSSFTWERSMNRAFPVPNGSSSRAFRSMPGSSRPASVSWSRRTCRRPCGCARPRGSMSIRARLLLPRPPGHSHLGPFRPALLAAAPVHHARQSILARHRLLQHSSRPRRRAWNAAFRLSGNPP